MDKMNDEMDNSSKENAKNKKDELNSSKDNLNINDIDKKDEVKGLKNADKKQINELKEQLDKTEDKYLRAEAEISNIQSHHKKERADLIKYSGQQLAHDVIPVMDDLDRALQVKVSDNDGSQLKKGIEMVYNHLEKALKDNNVTEISTENKKFDPHFFQAIQTVPADDEHPVDTIVKVLQKGYKLGDRVLRPAMVVVSQ